LGSEIELSIIIVNRNTKDLLIQCLGSIDPVGQGIEREVFVVDNGSEDGSGQAIRERFLKVTWIQNKMNIGFAKAMNQGLRLSKGKYLLLLNPDTQIKEGAIARLISFMGTHLDAGIVGAQLLDSDGSKQNSIANFPSLATELLNKSLLRWLFPKTFPGKERIYSEPIEVDSVIGACMMVRRDAMEQVGLLDEDYFLFLEETDWCYQIRKKGWKVYHIPQAEVYHFQGKSAEKEKKKAKIEYYRSRYHFFNKNKGNLQWLLLLIGLVMRLCVELIFTTMGCLMTIFNIKKWRQKLSVLIYLMWWHMRFCPKGMGLGSESTQLQAPASAEAATRRQAKSQINPNDRNP
jgi:GT2 family glycosyltransferase